MRMLAGYCRIICLVAIGALSSPAARGGLDTSDWRFSELWEDSDVSAWRLPPSLWLEAHERTCDSILTLTDDQKHALAGMVEAAEKEFAYGWLERKETLIDDELRESMKDPDERSQQSWRDHWKKMLSIRRELHALRQRLFAQVLADLRLIVTPEQAERWPDLERAMRRSFSLLHLANLRLEGLDLDALIRSMDPPEEVLEEIGPTLTQYLIELDVLLSARDQAAEALEREAREARELEEEWEEAHDSGDSRASRYQSKAERAGTSVVRAASRSLDASKRIAELNSMTLTRVQPHLPEDIDTKIAQIVASPLYTRRLNQWDQTQAHAALHLAENISSFTDSLGGGSVWGGTAGSKVGVSRLRAAVRPMTQEQADRIGEIRKKFEAEDMALRARLQPDDEADPSRSNWVVIRVPTGSVYLTRVDSAPDESSRHKRRQQEFEKKHAELILSTIKEVRAVLDPEQRMLIAAFMW